MAFGDAAECTGGENADANHADPCFSCVIEQPTVVLGPVREQPTRGAGL